MIIISTVAEWVRKNNLKYLGIPRLICYGHCLHGNNDFTFIVEEQYGPSIEDHFIVAGNRFSEDTVCYLALRVVSIGWGG